MCPIMSGYDDSESAGSGILRLSRDRVPRRALCGSNAAAVSLGAVLLVEMGSPAPLKSVLGLLAVLLFFATVCGAMAGAFFVAYGFVAWLDLPDLWHGVLGLVAVAASVAAGAFTAKGLDRIINPRLPLQNRARGRH